MEVIYLIFILVCVILFLFNITGNLVALLISLSIITFIYLKYNKKNILLLFIPILFLLRMFFFFNQDEYLVGDNIHFSTFLYKGIGKIEKIENKFVKNTYCCINYTRDGNYEISGKITKIENKYNKNYLTIETEEITPVSSSFLKKYLINKSENILQNSDYELRRIFKAVILGESYLIPKELKKTFSYIGISHLMALSGFHIGIVIGVFSYLLSFPLFQKKIDKKSKNIIYMLFLSLYYFGITSSPSLTRAYIMGMIILAGKVFDENTDNFKGLCLAFIISSFINPNDIFTLSFKLSYLAVFIIISIFPHIKNKIYSGNNSFIEGIILTIVIQVFLFPLILQEFGVIQIFSFISNIILVPLGSIFISLSFIGLLLENIALGWILIYPIEFSYKIFMFGVNLFSKFPLMSLQTNLKIYNFADVFYIILIIFTLYYKTRKGGIQNEKISKRTKILQ